MLPIKGRCGFVQITFIDDVVPTEHTVCFPATDFHDYVTANTCASHITGASTPDSDPHCRVCCSTFDIGNFNDLALNRHNPWDRIVFRGEQKPQRCASQTQGQPVRIGSTLKYVLRVAVAEGTSICAKLEVSHRTEATRVAIERGLIPLD